MKYSKSLFILSIVIVIFSCSKKVAEDVSELPPIVEEPAPIEEQTGPCITLSQLSPAQKDDAETAYVLYRDFYKAKDYEQAFPLWKKAFTLAPAANGRIKYQFDDGVGIYKEKYKTAAAEDKPDIVKAIMDIYNLRAECTGEAAYTQGRKAFDYYYYFKEHIEEAELFDLFKQAVAMKGDKSDYFVINPFTSMLYDHVLNKKISYDEGREIAKQLFSAIDYGTTNCDKDCDAWAVINDYAPSRLADLEGLEGFYDCAYYKEKYYSIYQATPDDCDVINQTYRRLRWGGCDDTDEMVQEIKAAKATKCYVAPPKESTLKQAYTAYTEGRYTEAVDLFQTFVDKTTDSDKKAKYLLLIGKIYYGDLKNFSKSRQKALEAAQHRSNWGEPYILIGKLYASSGPLCGPGRGWDSQIVTWPAIDKFEYAKKIDPSVASEANKWIGQYKQYMPKKEDIFFRSLKAGDSFKVGCWINETTRIRTSD